MVGVTYNKYSFIFYPNGMEVVMDDHERHLNSKIILYRITKAENSRASISGSGHVIGCH